MLLVKSFSGLNKYCFCCGNWIVKLWLDCRPSTIDALLIVDGVSERQCERFGEQLVNCVATFCKENNLEADKFSTDQPDSGSPTTSQVCIVRYIFQVGRKTRPSCFALLLRVLIFPYGERSVIQVSSWMDPPIPVASVATVCWCPNLLFMSKYKGGTSYCPLITLHYSTV